VEKYGTPNGVVGFSGVALEHRVFDELATGNLDIVFPVTRTHGATGNITVTVTTDSTAIIFLVTLI